MPKTIIYLDHAAATPLDTHVLAAMQPFFRDQFYNPSSAYQPARDVKMALQAARQTVAACLKVKPQEIIFTAGATESINLAIQGATSSSGHIVSCQTEHAAVLETLKRYPHTLAPVESDGSVELDSLAESITDQTELVSMAMVNNEIGTIQPIRKIAEIVQTIRQQRQRRGNKTPLLFHSDGSQAAELLSLDMHRLGLDLLTLNGAKIYGPKQTGLLCVKKSIKLQPIMYGGGQENGWRAGTENVPGIIGFAKALVIAQQQRQTETLRIQSLAQIFLTSILAALPQTVIVAGNTKKSAAHIVNLSWPGLDAERLLLKLEEKGVLVATGAACSAAWQTRSHVLLALGLDAATIDGSLRFSFGRTNTEQQVERAANIVVETVKLERPIL